MQHEIVKEVLNVRYGKTTPENCVLQREARSITVQTSAKLLMKNWDLCDAKDAGVEIYPGSACTLLSNGMYCCKEGILKDNFLD